MPDKIEKKRLNADLTIALIVMGVALALVMIFGQSTVLAPVAHAPLLVKTLYTAFVQFSIAGLGTVLVMVIRREGFAAYGLKKEGACKSLLYGLGLIVLLLIYDFIKDGILQYFPFRQVMLTEEALGASFPMNVLSMAIIALTWGFFEGFNYVFFNTKINALIPIKIPYLRLGPIIMGVACIFIHGAVGQDMLAMLDAFLVVYLSLLIPELTGNAWGTILVFLLYWNAV